MSGPTTTQAVPGDAETTGIGAEMRDVLATCRAAEEMFAAAAATRREADENAAEVAGRARTFVDGLCRRLDREAEDARRDLAAWVSAQHAAAEAAVTEILESARDEAATLRAEAIASAMAEAEAAARDYAQERLEQAFVEAGETCDRARDIILSADGLLSGIGASSDPIDDAEPMAVVRALRPVPAVETSDAPTDIDSQRASAAAAIRRTSARS